MNGKQLKRIIEDSGRKMADCAIALGITPQSLNSAFHFSDVKSGYAHHARGNTEKKLASRRAP